MKCVVAILDPFREKGHHRTGMMGNDFERGIAVQDPTKDQSRHGGRRLKRPAKNLPDFILRDLFVYVVRHRNDHRVTTVSSLPRPASNGSASDRYPFRGLRT